MCISTHTLTWSVTITVIAFWTITLISTHTLTWSVTSLFRTFSVYAVNFNSHAHVERDQSKFYDSKVTYISTHTLTWSVTCWKMLLVSILHFNSHAHVERDLLLPRLPLLFPHFNSHAHVERDKYQ